MARRKNPIRLADWLDLHQGSLLKILKECGASEEYARNHSWHYAYHAIWPSGAEAPDSVLPKLYSQNPDLFLRIMTKVRKLVSSGGNIQSQAALYISMMCLNNRKEIEKASDKEIADMLTEGIGHSLGNKFTAKQVAKAREVLQSRGRSDL